MGATSIRLGTEDANGGGQRISGEDQILEFLKISGGASPAVIRNSLGLSRSRVYRSLQRLSQERQVHAHGQTRDLVYQLNQTEPPPDMIGMN